MQSMKVHRMTREQGAATALEVQHSKIRQDVQLAASHKGEHPSSPNHLALGYTLYNQSMFVK